MRRLFSILALLLLVQSSAVSKTQLLIEGMESLSRNDIDLLIGGRFDHIKNQPPSRARAADGAFMIEQLFRKNGYNNASVTWKVLDPNTIRYRVTEGSRITLGEVRVQGVEDDDLTKKLEGLFRLNPQKRRISASKSPPFRKSDIDVGLGLIEAELQSIGFWSPRVEVSDRAQNPETGDIDITILAIPGELYRISDPIFSNGSNSALDTIAATYKNRPANTTNLNGLRLDVSDYYRSEGFVNAKVRMEVNLDSTAIRPKFRIEEGKRFRLGELNFEGLEKTNPERIKSRIKGLEGNYIDGERTDRRVRQMIATGAFSTVRIETIERDGDILDATLHFEEAKARGISLTGGVGTYEGIIIGATYYDRNFMGQLWNFSAGAEYTQRSLLGEISLTDPWLFGTDTKGKVRLYSLSRSNEGYDNWTVGLEAGISHPVTEHYFMDVTLGIAGATTTSDGIPNADLGETDYLHPYLLFTHRLDFRDSPVLPSTGGHLTFPLAIGAALGTDSTSYIKGGIEGSYHLPLGADSKLAFGARADLIIPSGKQLPIDLRLFNGGPRSVRSYPERELGPQSFTGYPIGGQASWVTNVEYIRPLAGALKGVVFVDAGGLSSDWEDFGFDEIEVALGLGIRFDLPIGPVRLEYGHNMTQDRGEPSGTFHFAIGSAF